MAADHPASQAAPSTAALLIVGAEILSGKVDDQNGPFLIRALRSRGVEVTEVRIIGDDVDSIVDALRALSAKVDYVLTTGGIGPTHDDKTLEAVAKAFDTRLVRHAELERLVRERRGGDMNAAWLKMVEMPEGARVRLAEGSQVPIAQLHNVTVLPGVPSLMRLCFATVADGIRGATFHGRTLLLGVSETTVAAHLARVQQEHPGVAIGSYPRFDGAGFRVKVTIDGRDEDAVLNAYSALRQYLEPGWVLEEE